MGKLKGVLDAVVRDFFAAEGGEIGAGAKFCPNVLGESSNISAGTAMNAEGKFWVIVV